MNAKEAAGEILSRFELEDHSADRAEIIDSVLQAEPRLTSVEPASEGWAWDIHIDFPDEICAFVSSPWGSEEEFYILDEEAMREYIL